MTVKPLGESAYLLQDLPAEPYRIAAALNESPPMGLIEAVASYDSVGLYVDPDRFRLASVDPPPIAPEAAAKRHRIPVCYEMGPDLVEAANRLGLSEDDLVQLHAGEVYRCAAVGFRPGFAYLGELDARIAGLPRRSEPRLNVEAGSVGITGRQTGVYPMASPGGWWLIGRTPLLLVEPDSGYYPIEAGDEVVFEPIDRSEFARRIGERL